MKHVFRLIVIVIVFVVSIEGHCQGTMNVDQLLSLKSNIIDSDTQIRIWIKGANPDAASIRKAREKRARDFMDRVEKYNNQYPNEPDLYFIKASLMFDLDMFDQTFYLFTRGCQALKFKYPKVPLLMYPYLINTIPCVPVDGSLYIGGGPIRPDSVKDIQIVPISRHLPIKAKLSLLASIDDPIEKLTHIYELLNHVFSQGYFDAGNLHYESYLDGSCNGFNFWDDTKYVISKVFEEGQVNTYHKFMILEIIGWATKLSKNFSDLKEQLDQMPLTDETSCIDGAYKQLGDQFTLSDISKTFYAVIIANYEFDGRVNSFPSDSEQSIDNMVDLLVSKYSFQEGNIKLFKNITGNEYNELKTKIDNNNLFAFPFPEVSSLFIFVLSHGQRGVDKTSYILSADNRELNIGELFNSLRNNTTTSQIKNILYLEDACYGTLQSGSEISVIDRGYCDIYSGFSRKAVLGGNGKPIVSLTATKDFTKYLNDFNGDFFTIEEMFKTLRSAKLDEMYQLRVFDESRQTGNASFTFFTKEYLSDKN